MVFMILNIKENPLHFAKRKIDLLNIRKIMGKSADICGHNSGCILLVKCKKNRII